MNKDIFLLIKTVKLKVISSILNANIILSNVNLTSNPLNLSKFSLHLTINSNSI